MKQHRKTRKAVDKLNGFDSREALWQVIRKMKTFTVRELQMESTLEVSTVRDYVTGLFKAGYLKKDEQPIASSSPMSRLRPKVPVYELIKDVGVDAPRVRKDGNLVTQGQGRINMWRTMLVLKTFTAKELALASSTPSCIVKFETAKDYILHLHRAGYLTQRKKGTYHFFERKYTGPKPPMVQRVKRVWDQNLKKVMWREDGGAK